MKNKNHIMSIQRKQPY